MFCGTYKLKSEWQSIGLFETRKEAEKTVQFHANGKSYLVFEIEPYDIALIDCISQTLIDCM